MEFVFGVIALLVVFLWLVNLSGTPKGKEIVRKIPKHLRNFLWRIFAGFALVLNPYGMIIFGPFEMVCDWFGISNAFIAYCVFIPSIALIWAYFDIKNGSNLEEEN